MAAGDAIVRSNAMQATTIVEFFIGEGRILVELEIGAADVAAFRNLMPDGIYEGLGHTPQPLAERLQEFFARDLPILGPDGEPLSGGVLEIGPEERILRDSITGEPLPTKEGDRRESPFGYSFTATYQGDLRAGDLAFETQTLLPSGATVSSNFFLQQAGPLSGIGRDIVRIKGCYDPGVDTELRIDFYIVTQDGVESNVASDTFDFVLPL